LSDRFDPWCRIAGVSLSWLVGARAACQGPPMVAPSAADLELAFVEKFFWSQGREPYPVQEQASARSSAARACW
jgi:hypothetical protein